MPAPPKLKIALAESAIPVPGSPLLKALTAFAAFVSAAAVSVITASVPVTTFTPGIGAVTIASAVAAGAAQFMKLDQPDQVMLPLGIGGAWQGPPARRDATELQAMPGLMGLSISCGVWSWRSR